MARVSKPAVVADKPAARRVSRARKSMRSSRHPPESGADTMETTESRVATAIAPPPEIETAALEAAALETLEEAMIEPPAAAMPPVESDQAAAEVPEPPEPIVAPGEPAALFAPSESATPAAPAQAEPSGATISFAVPALGEIQRLQGIGLSFWQDQLKRTMATGQAIMVCRSPQAVIGLQMAYVQATLASGFEHASQLTRLSQDLVRNLSSSRPR